MKDIYIESFFNSIVIEGAFFEVRILHTKKGTLSGYFDDPKKLLRAINPYDGQYNIFFTLNTVMPDVVSRSVNHFKEWAKNTTTDREIVRRDWILIDLDPDRPAGVSSTNEELSHAKMLAEKLIEFLTEQGFSQPVECMSGNGYHLLYPISLENTQENTILIKEFLAGIDKKFSDEAVKVDTTTYNAARITKLYGTIACKGDDTETRPHRRSSILSAPEILECIDVERIRNVISLCDLNSKDSGDKESSIKSERSKEARYRQPKIDIKVFCESHGIEISHEKPYCDGKCFVLTTCPWNPDHTDRSAYIIEFPNGKITAGCHHDSCSEENWRSLLKKFPDMKEYVQKPEREISKKDDSMSASEVLMEDIKEAGHQFYHDKGENAYVAVPLENGHIEYMAVRDRRYRQLLQNMYYQTYKKALRRDSRQQVVDTVEAEAIFQGTEINPGIRCKYYDGKIYYYIADEEQTVVCIDKMGIHVLESSPIPFIRSYNMLEQVMPMDRVKKDGKKPSFRTLARKYWRFKTEDDLLLHNVVLLTRFVSDIPCPILYYRGDRGSAKTTSMRLDQLFLDPSNTDIRALPSTEKDIVAILYGSYSVAFDNIEGNLPTNYANLFCICSTSGYYSKRKLFYDNDTVDVPLHTHLSFSGITNISHRADLLDRCICLASERIPDSERRTEKEILTEFKDDLPYLLFRGMRILSKALKIIENLELSELPRMGDFAKIGYAVAEVMKYGGDHFLEVYKKNQENLLEVCVEEDALLTLIITFTREISYFRGTMTELQGALAKHAQKMDIDARYLMKTGHALSRKLFESQSVLDMFGIHLERGKSNGERYVELWGGNSKNE